MISIKTNIFIIVVHLILNFYLFLFLNIILLSILFYFFIDFNIFILHSTILIYLFYKNSIPLAYKQNKITIIVNYSIIIFITKNTIGFIK